MQWIGKCQKRQFRGGFNHAGEFITEFTILIFRPSWTIITVALFLILPKGRPSGATKGSSRWDLFNG